MSLAYNTRFKVSKSYNSFLWENGNTALETIGHFHAYKLLEIERASPQKVKFLEDSQIVLESQNVLTTCYKLLTCALGLKIED